MRAVKILFCGGLVGALAGCSYRVEKEKALTPVVSGTVGFAQVQADVLGPRCARCHAGDILASYEAVTAVLPEISRRIQLTRGAGGAMPPAGPLSEAEISLVLGWIAKGAPLVPGEEGGGSPAPGPTPAPAPVPAPPVPGPSPGIPSFAEVQANVLIPKCARCHSDMVASYETVKASLFEIELSVQNRVMPPRRASPLTEEERALLLRWIAAGAPRLGDSSPAPEPAPPDCEDGDDDDHDDFASLGKRDCDRQPDDDQQSTKGNQDENLL